MSTPQKNQPLRSAKQSLAVLANAFKQIGGCNLFAVYGVFLLVCCALFCILEPETITILIGLSSLVVVALITGTVVNYYNEMMRLRKNESIMFFDEHMRKLTELSPDELSELERKYHDFTKGHRR